MAKKKPAPKKTAKKAAAVKIDAVRHQDKRKNIPTEELRDFVRKDDQHAPPVLYPRDPSLDPQLVWKGKDEQDSQDFAVPTVPIFIQEKVHPQHIVDDFIASLELEPQQKGSRQMELFSDFNGLPEEFDQRVDFYQHDGHWSNRMILGDSLLVMNSLVEKEGLKGEVQTIYLDPPYGIKFGSNWQVSTRKRDVKDGKESEATRQPEQIRAFRDTWKLGIHSYLAYLRDRLVVSRELLTESGSIFVQIGDENLHLVRCVLDEVFGAENFVAIIAFKSSNPLGSSGLPKPYDYIVWFAKKQESLKFRRLLRDKKLIEDKEYRFFDGANDGEAVSRLSETEVRDLSDTSRVFRRQKLTSSGYTPTCTFDFELFGRLCKPMTGKSWSTNRDGIERLKMANRLFFTGKNPCYKRYFADAPFQLLDNCWTDIAGAEEQRYVVQTGTKFVERCILMTTDPGDLVFDPTCGSGTTAYVAEQWGRRWITTDTSRVALTLARSRLMTARYPYYFLASEFPNISQSTADNEVRKCLKTPTLADASSTDIRKGFVYKRVPHVTLRSIANNPDLRQGMTREEIDAAITRHSDTELLFDQPYEDNKRVRVTGPFTVESLSPHRTISVAEKTERSEHWKDGRSLKVLGPDNFGQMIIDNLRKSGVQNTKKKQRLKFNSIEPYAGQWIHAVGHYTEEGGGAKRAAICIGPEYGTVGPELVKEAAKEAVQGVGFDLLLVCGFAFDPHVTEESKRYGNLVVLPCRMNPDLAMGDELLKKTGAGNLFMVFGEPDLDVTKTKDGQIVVEIRGVDVYDPTTGEIRSSSTDDIACWFIDTNYNGESFFVRHAYFTGADEPYDKLKRALRAEVDEDAWSQLYSTTSRPFPKPDTGKIAVKVINHYGDEVLKVYVVS